MIELAPQRAGAYNNRGLAYAAKQDQDRAIIDFTEAVRLDPKYAHAYANRGTAYAAKNADEQAMVDHIEALRLGLTVADTYNDFARLWAGSSDPELRNGEMAIELATRACELSGWEHWNCLRTLAAAHSAADQFDEAVRVTEKAIILAPDSEKDVLRAELTDYKSAG